MSAIFIFDEKKVKPVSNIYKIYLDGEKAKTQDEFNQEMIEIFRLPPYFNGNFDSLDECLNDLNWLSETDDFELIILNFDSLLEEEKEDYLITFIEMLKDINLNFFRYSNDKTKQIFYVVLEKTIKSASLIEQLGIKIDDYENF
jgi:RNAse (barnase) inhibitor barstar